MTNPSSRRTIALLLLATWALGGCMQYVEPATLENGDRIDAVRIAGGGVIRFGGDETARYEPPDVVVRDEAGTELRRIPESSVEAVYDKRLAVAPMIVGVVMTAAIVTFVVVNMEDYENDPADILE